MGNNQTTILLIDSHISDASKIKVFLEHNTEKPFKVWHCNSRAEGVHFLKESIFRVDAIILDLFLVDPINPKETYKIIGTAAGEIPIIIITGERANALAHELTISGAADVVIRERFEVYPRRLLNAIENSIIRGKLLHEFKEKSIAEVQEHKRMLHWMTGGYSVEMQAEANAVIKIIQDGKNAA